MAAIEVVTIERFKCPTCGATYGERHLAELCAARPVSQDRGVKVGDTVRITGGDGAGGTATVERISVLGRDWGHYAWERYWHTVALHAKVNGSWGHRMLTFDNYELIGAQPQEADRHDR